MCSYPVVRLQSLSIEADELDLLTVLATISQTSDPPPAEQACLWRHKCQQAEATTKSTFLLYQS